MQKTIYICDQCSKPIGSVPHLSLVVGHDPATGVAMPPEKGGIWVVKSIPHNFVHLHIRCIEKFFEKLCKSK